MFPVSNPYISGSYCKEKYRQLTPYSHALLDKSLGQAVNHN